MNIFGISRFGQSAISLLFSRLLVFSMALIGCAFAAPNYQEHIAPIFESVCTECHNAGKQSAGLDLSSFASVMKGSSGGEVVRPGLPDTSALYLAITHAEGVKPMPDEGEKLADDEISLIQEWIAGGLIDKPGGKSLLREMSGYTKGEDGPTVDRPTEAIYPSNLPEVPATQVLNPLPVMALAVNPWSDVIAVNRLDQIAIYGRTEPSSQFQHLGNLPYTEEEIHDLRFSPDGRYLLAAGGGGGYFGGVVLYDVVSGKLLKKLAKEDDVVLSADISPDNKHIGVGTPLKRVKIYSVDTGALLHEIDKHTDWVTAVAFSPDGKWLASGDRNGTIYVWEVATGGIAYTLSEHNSQIHSLSWRADSKVLLSGGDDGKLVLWDMKDGWPSRSIKAHDEKSETRYTRHTGVLGTTIDDEDGMIYSIGRNRVLTKWKPDGNRASSQSLDLLPTQVVNRSGSDYLVVGSAKGDVFILSKDKLEIRQGFFYESARE